MTTVAAAAPRVRTRVSSLMLGPRKIDKLVIYLVAELARRRWARVLKLNFPESIALITEALLEAAPDGRSVAEVIELGTQVLSREDVTDGVAEMVTWRRSRPRSRRLAVRAGPRACRWSAPRYEHLGPVRLPRTAES
jgi:urease subunit gamma